MPAIRLKKPPADLQPAEGDYAGAEADPIMIDFWVTNGNYRVTEA